MTDLTLAQRSAPHRDRKQLVTFRKTTHGRRACSEPLLVGGMSRLVVKNKQVLAEALDDALEFVSWLGGGREQHIEAGLETRVIGGQGRGGE
jgi:hypothetical protein